MAEVCELNIEESVTKAKKNWFKLAALPDAERSKLIESVADAILKQQERILSANQKDLEVAKKENISSALLDRLSLTPGRLESMVQGLRKVASLPDPLAETIEWKHSKGMLIKKVRVPIGLILVVYEARPNVTTDTVALALKTGNAAILKGSRQTKYTNAALAEVIQGALRASSLDNVFAFFPVLNAEQSLALVSHEGLDLIIPRGGEGLKAFVKENAKAPVLGAGGGVCHVYVAESADLEAAKNIIFNAKTQRPSVCNALETVLLHESLLKPEILEELLKPLIQAKVLLKADQAILKVCDSLQAATEEDWSTEYLDLILALKSVKSSEEAVEHINRYSTGHSDAIITQNQAEAELFCKSVDSSCVYVNASTRFTDGEEFGFGAEIGISTQKLHARGPIGPHELTTYKYLIIGNGQVR